MSLSPDLAVAVLRLRDPSYERDGELFVDDNPLQTLPWVAPSLCNHDDGAVGEVVPRVCPVCLPSWLHDWEVWVPAAGVSLSR